MKRGSKVVYVDSQGREFAATVDAVRGTGPSFYKVLDLSFSDHDGKAHERAHVRHERDSGGRVHWREGVPSEARHSEGEAGLSESEAQGEGEQHDEQDEPPSE